MSALAGMFHEDGWSVEGSDRVFHPPASELLKSLKIPLKDGYRKENVPMDCEIYVIGNSISANNEEARFIIERGFPYLSMAEALQRYFLNGKRIILVTGTHGKTTTTSIIGWGLRALGFSAGYFVGGILKNTGKSYSTGNDFYVVEGDEYETAFFDRSPKFLHFKPEIIIINSLEFDHADFYRSIEEVKSAFRELIRKNPSSKLFCCEGWRFLHEIIQELDAEVEWYGPGERSFWKPLSWGNGEFLFETPLGKISVKNRYLSGRHNASNLSAFLAVAHFLKIDIEKASSVLGEFQGVRRRQEFIAEVNGIKIYDDFAHHPTAVSVTLDAFREIFPERRLIVVFEPRTHSSRRKVFEDDFISAFSRGDVLFFLPVYGASSLSPGEVLSLERMVEILRKRGKSAILLDGYGDVSKIVEHLERGDVVIFMSSGDMNGMPVRLANALKGR